jgi:hypothetical protein
MEDFSETSRYTEVILICKHEKTSVTPVYVLKLYTNLLTRKTSMTPVDVLRLYTNLQTWKTSVTLVYYFANRNYCSGSGWLQKITGHHRKEQLWKEHKKWCIRQFNSLFSYCLCFENVNLGNPRIMHTCYWCWKHWHRRTYWTNSRCGYLSQNRSWSR